jgi:hypothetical protein
MPSQIRHANAALRRSAAPILSACPARPGIFSKFPGRQIRVFLKAMGDPSGSLSPLLKGGNEAPPRRRARRGTFVSATGRLEYGQAALRITQGSLTNAPSLRRVFRACRLIAARFSGGPPGLRPERERLLPRHRWPARSNLRFRRHMGRGLRLDRRCAPELGVFAKKQSDGIRVWLVAAEAFNTVCKELEE